MRVPGPLGFVSLWYVSIVRLVVGCGFFASLTGSLCFRFWGRVLAFGSGFVGYFHPFFVYELAYFIDVWAVFVCI